MVNKDDYNSWTCGIFSTSYQIEKTSVRFDTAQSAYIVMIVTTLFVHRAATRFTQFETPGDVNFTCDSARFITRARGTICSLPVSCLIGAIK